ncbi:uncharacterized protein GGS22DRAFT_8684 [Annulohypoxylon maeteangense]|uniref:uncharacterized protein n=1 Tax=Annulohypoxylon maeteangense TaxID=1927788 RepID=UPI002007C43B|nr:uncharacterized protein GGS22DRAFT_8684 [Annulohypoxylon maeteangense]KAI0890120.1 hypothetical protein GGS22DRAFT_8684 [Annulohypoxylon maeteangense]
MAHSPLLRTLMRLRLDSRSVALVNYELALEDVSVKLQQLPRLENFDDNRWTDLRKTYDNKKMRETQQKSFESHFSKKVLEKRRLQHDTNNILQAWKEIIPTKPKELKLALAKSGFAEWKPPLPSESLLSEQYSYNPFSSGRVHVADVGIIDRRLLHHALSPKYVPKPHFKMERIRLEAKSAEYAAFAENNRHMIPRPQDESSDEALLSEDEAGHSEREDAKGGKVKLGKRKRVTKEKPKPKKRTRKPAKFVKLYDCKAHDRAQLNSQAISLFSLMQQRVPRIESPAFERVNRAIKSRKDSNQVSTPMDIDEDPTVEEFRIHGILLPIRLPFEESSNGEPREPTIEDAAQYQCWRRRARPFFEERDRYMQSRIYYERVNDRELSHAVQALVAFWSKLNTQLGS